MGITEIPLPEHPENKTSHQPLTLIQWVFQAANTLILKTPKQCGSGRTLLRHRNTRHESIRGVFEAGHQPQPPKVMVS